ncbi:ribosome silencing factor RsfS/YbeB/iojap [Bacteroidales bacterium 6E]|jgi:ribosome-associated protein|nr:ribosome silencing factor RsfS/YbeB/iojap [Bacteroidales bacterium 6E]
MRKKSTETPKILEAAIEGIRRIKGKELLLIDLTTIHHSECSYFLVCHGTSNTQVEALAHSVEDTVQELTGEKTWHKDGYRNAIWILLDFGDIMVHVFKEEARTFYNLEGLWSDAKITQIEEDN